MLIANGCNGSFTLQWDDLYIRILQCVKLVYADLMFALILATDPDPTQLF